jgi:hypothetical protein
MSVPPEAATEMLISFSRPTSVANVEASEQSASHDMLELENKRDWTVIRRQSFEILIRRILAIAEAESGVGVGRIVVDLPSRTSWGDCKTSKFKRNSGPPTRALLLSAHFSPRLPRTADLPRLRFFAFHLPDNC